MLAVSFGLCSLEPFRLLTKDPPVLERFLRLHVLLEARFELRRGERHFHRDFFGFELHLNPACQAFELE